MNSRSRRPSVGGKQGSPPPHAISRRGWCAILCVIVVLALAVRAVQLDVRPFHSDEAVGSWRFAHLWHHQDGRTFHYDPVQFHGPMLAYATWPIAWLHPASTWAESTIKMYRTVPLLFGVAVVLLTGLLAGGIGRPAALVAAFFCALSPAMVYHSRYYIHEMLLVCFASSAIWAGWQYVQARQQKRRAMSWACLTGVCLGLVHATKETSMIFLFAMGVAAAAAMLISTLKSRQLLAILADRRRWVDIAVLLAAAAFVSVAIYSEGFTYWQGPIDAIKGPFTYELYYHNEGQALHEHPWHWYLSILAFGRDDQQRQCAELLIFVLCVIAIVAAALRKGVEQRHLPLVRFFVIYTVVMFTVYTVMAYKTPWNMLGFLHGMIVLAGVGAAAVVGVLRRIPGRIIAIAAIGAGVIHLGVITHKTSFKTDRHSDYHNPYAYGNTLASIDQIRTVVERLAAVHPQGRAMPIRLVDNIPGGESCWPIQFYLRDFDEVELNVMGSIPEPADASVIILNAKYENEVRSRISGPYKIFPFELRFNVYYYIYIDAPLFNALTEADRTLSELPWRRDDRERGWKEGFFAQIQVPWGVPKNRGYMEK